MANTLHKIIEDFDQLSDGNRRVIIHRLKRRKTKMEKQLNQINTILESYEKLKDKRAKEKKEAVRKYWQGNIE
jgi:hypothetical protein